MASFLFLPGCSTTLGGPCRTSTDCPSQGEQICDTSQPNGACIIPNCWGDHAKSCPSSTVCVLFSLHPPGCGTTGMTPRNARSLCMPVCTKDIDCRKEDGYACLRPTVSPWNAHMQGTEAQICMPRAPSPEEQKRANQPAPPVCQP